jgi:hypothetical protein
VLGDYVKPQFSAEHLMGLDPHDTIVRMTFAGRTETPFSMATMKPPEITLDTQEIIHQIRQQSRSRYARPAAEVDDALARTPASTTPASEAKHDSFYG